MIPQDIKYALMGREKNYYSKILDIVIAYQRGEWSKIIIMASYLGFNRENYFLNMGSDPNTKNGNYL
ncbi:hypothetical protein AB8U03_09760 [Clostridium sp. Mt-5]|uniref:Uncharacterized protein n=2 Tax=Clostridium moutaii TaxID=3240932 RepID=A0ABV4BNW5_9CLOT